jgi:hypothetical protein
MRKVIYSYYNKDGVFVVDDDGFRRGGGEWVNFVNGPAEWLCALNTSPHTEVTHFYCSVVERRPVYSSTWRYGIAGIEAFIQLMEMSRHAANKPELEVSYEPEPIRNAL